MTPDNEGNIAMLTASFWTGAIDRAVKSAAQSLLLLWGADEGLNIIEIDLGSSLGLAGGAVALSLLTSIVSAPAGDKGSTSLLPGGK